MTDIQSTPIADKARRVRTRRQAAAAAPAPVAPLTKLDQIVAMLSRPEGASLAELVAATCWQAHSVRGALAGSLKRKGVSVRSAKLDGERRYRIGSEQ
jgi:Protein of unknown function (DUF3489)